MKIKISVETDDGECYSYGVTARNSIDSDVTTMHIRAGMKSLYQHMLRKLNFSAAEITAKLTTQMVDMPTKNEMALTEAFAKIYQEYPTILATSAFIKPIND